MDKTKLKQLIKDFEINTKWYAFNEEKYYNNMNPPSKEELEQFLQDYQKSKKDLYEYLNLEI